MPRWLRLVRGMLGTGVAFAVGGPAIVATIGLGFWLFGNASLGGVAFTAARSSVVSFVIGVLFSGILALAAHGRGFEKLSFRLFTALGGGVGFAAFIAMGLSGAFSAWSFDTGFLNFVLLTSIGAGAAAATLLVARKATAAVGSGEERVSFGEEPASSVDMSRDSERVRPRE